MTDLPRGMPLLSGPPPEPPLNERTDVSCRKCNKEFSVLFARGRRCNHCGYSYCYSCSDYQALMPRRGSSNDVGYDRAQPHQREHLVTAGGKPFLRSLPLSRLKNYMQAYGLRVGADVLEKDDIINAIIAARTENGCLPRTHENYYRKYSVPSGQTSRPRGLFSRSERTEPPRQFLDPRAGWVQTNNFDRPDLQSDRSPRDHGVAHQEFVRQQAQQREDARNQYVPPPGPPPYATYASSVYGSQFDPRTPHPHPQFHPQYQHPEAMPRAPPNNYRTSAPSSNRTNESVPSRRPATAPPPQQSPARPRAPTLDELLEMQEEEVSALSVGVLKDILESNHVRPGLVLEKSEIVARVNALVTAERRERARTEAIREREEWEAQEREWAARERDRAAREAREREEREEGKEEERRQRREAYRATVESASESDDTSQGHSPLSEPTQPPSGSPPVPEVTQKASEDVARGDRSRSPSPAPSRPAPERSGLCVVCQDEEANIVVIDCGHLALCRGCSDLVWSSSRECPLCRTRIVTQARLLRVFRT